MPFFDDLSKKISKAGQTALQKTKDMADIAKLNSVISDEENNIEKIYTQIGKMYVQAHPNDSDVEYSALIAEIHSKEEKISELRRQMQDIKGVVRCQQCGSEVPMGASFCNSCGAKINTEITNQSNMIECEKCKALVSKDLKFCTSCGNPLHSENTSNDTQPQEKLALVVEL